MEQILEKLMVSSDACVFYLLATGIFLVFAGTMLNILPKKFRIEGHIAWLAIAMTAFGIDRILNTAKFSGHPELYSNIELILKIVATFCTLEFSRRNIHLKDGNIPNVFIHVPVAVLFTIAHTLPRSTFAIYLSILYIFVKSLAVYNFGQQLFKSVTPSTAKKVSFYFPLFLGIFAQGILYSALNNADLTIKLFPFISVSYLLKLDSLVITMALMGLIASYYIYESGKLRNNESKWKPVLPIIVCIISLCTGIMGTDTFIRLAEHRKTELQNSVDMAAGNLAKMLNERIKFVSTSASIIAGMPSIINYFEYPSAANLNQINNFLNTFNSINPGTLCLVMDTKGSVIALSAYRDKIIGKNFSFRPYFEKASNGLSYISFHTGYITGVPGFFAASPIINPKNMKIVGVIAVKKDVTTEKYIFKENAPAILVDGNNQIIMAGNDRFIGTKVPAINSYKETPDQITPETLASFPGFDRQYQCKTEPLIDSSWKIMVLRRNKIDHNQCVLIFVIILMVVFFSATLYGMSRTTETFHDYEETQKQFKLLFDYAPSCVFIISASDDIILAANHQLALQFASPNELIGCNYKTLLAEPDKYNGIDTEAITGVYKAECTYKKFTGEEFIGEITGSSIIFGGNEAKMIILHDISSHKTIEKQLKEANQLKGRFFANASHEVKTPMTAIIGLTELAVSICSDENQRHILDLIRTSSKSMMSLVNDILDFSEIESGQFLINTLKFDLKLLIKDLSEIIKFNSERRICKLQTEIDSTVPSSVASDPDRIRQILLNLVYNVLYADSDKPLLLYVSAEDKANEEINCDTLITFSLDTGRIMSKDDQQIIFDAIIYSNPYTRNTKQQGGFSLSVTKQIIDAMHGSITISGEPNETTKFTIRIPVKKDPSNISVSQKEELLTIKLKNKGRPLKFLVADDNEINLFVANSIIQKFGGITESASNGEEVLQIINQNKDELFDCILLDIQMPKLDGISVIKQIRSSEGPLKNVPIIAISAFASEQEGKIVSNAGATEYLSKPYYPEDLLNILKKHLNVTYEAHADLTSKEPIMDKVASDLSKKEKESEEEEDLNLKYINLKSLKIRLLRKPEDIIKISEIFNRRCSELTKDIDRCIDSNDPMTMREIAHSIKGLTAMLSADVPAKKAKEAESLSASGQTETLRAIFKELKDMLLEINDDLQIINNKTRQS